MKTFKSFLLDQISEVAKPKAKGEKDFFDAHKVDVSDPEDQKNHSAKVITKEKSGKRPADNTKTEELSPKQKALDKNKNGKIDGSDLAHLRSKKKQPQGADFAAQRRKERMASTGRMDEADEADFTKKQTTMAHAIGKHFAKKKVGDPDKGGPYAVATAMVRDKPDTADKTYKTIKAKAKNEEHLVALTALYDELHEDNKKFFIVKLDEDYDNLVKFAMSIEVSNDS
jgi:hypothetical protein